MLNENLAELRELAQDALEDAVLMGCDERQVREVLAGDRRRPRQPLPQVRLRRARWPRLARWRLALCASAGAART